MQFIAAILSALYGMNVMYDTHTGSSVSKSTYIPYPASATKPMPIATQPIGVMLKVAAAPVVIVAPAPAVDSGISNPEEAAVAIPLLTAGTTNVDNGAPAALTMVTVLVTTGILVTAVVG